MPNLSETAAALRAFALSLPDAAEDFPWGERVVKVRTKVFVFLGAANAEGAGGLSLTVKLPHSGERLLEQPYAKPTGYGLGRSGWVTLRFAPNDRPDPAPLLALVEESWRAVAPKRLVNAYAASARADGP